MKSVRQVKNYLQQNDLGTSVDMESRGGPYGAQIAEN